MRAPQPFRIARAAGCAHREVARMVLCFEDRVDAGAQLAEALARAGERPDLVLGIPRGGVVVAAPVAERFGVPLDVAVARKIPAPGHPELAIGAVGPDGSRVLVADVMAHLPGVDDRYIARAADQQTMEARRRLSRYRAGFAMPDLLGHSVVVVDDGIATGATTEAALHFVRSLSPKRLVLAVPVASGHSLARMRGLVDSAVVLEPEMRYGAVGAYYEDFEQTSDAEVERLLMALGPPPLARALREQARAREASRERESPGRRASL